MGEIRELFVLALSLVWFAGATPESWHCMTAARASHVNLLGVAGLEQMSPCTVRKEDFHEHVAQPLLEMHGETNPVHIHQWEDQQLQSLKIPAIPQA